MKTTKLLLPYGFKCAGWWILAVAMVLSVLYFFIPESSAFGESLPRSWNDFRVLFGLDPIPVKTGMESLLLHGFDADCDLMLTLTGVLLLLGGVFIGFSRNREEDEYISYIRYESLIIALYANSIVLLISLFSVWGLSFLYVMLYNMFTALYIFIVFFYIRLWINKGRGKREDV